VPKSSLSPDGSLSFNAAGKPSTARPLVRVPAGPPFPNPPPGNGKLIVIIVRPSAQGNVVVTEGPHGLTAVTTVVIEGNSDASKNGTFSVNPVGFPPNVFRSAIGSGSSTPGQGGRWRLA